MGRKPKVINFDTETNEMLDQLRSKIGQQVPLSHRYVSGNLPILVAVENDRATLKYGNGATFLNVPLRDLVNDAGYWRG